MGKRMNQPKRLSRTNLDSVPDQSGVYDILNRSGDVNYTGSAGAGRLRDRLTEHLRDEDIPGGTHFRFRPTSSTKEARRIEGDRIHRLKPPYNTQGT